jgi:hypothetical protein
MKKLKNLVTIAMNDPCEDPNPEFKKTSEVKKSSTYSYRLF